jgi:hypothetical protein
MGATVRVINDTKGAGLEALAERLRTLRGTVLVGVPKGTTEPDGTSTALVVATNEFGSPDRGIPERSAFRGGIRRGRPIFHQLNERNIAAVARGSMTGHQALSQLGAAAVGAVQTEMTTGHFVPNAPATIARKGSSRPWIDTGHARQSVTFIVDEGQEGPGIVR